MGAPKQETFTNQNLFKKMLKVHEKKKEWRNQLKNAGVSIAPQPEVPLGRGGWISFGGPTSKLTKPSFLVFARSHPEYDYVWFLEHDVFYTGKYGAYIDDILKLGSTEG